MTTPIPQAARPEPIIIQGETATPESSEVARLKIILDYTSEAHRVCAENLDAATVQIVRLNGKIELLTGNVAWETSRKNRLLKRLCAEAKSNGEECETCLTTGFICSSFISDMGVDGLKEWFDEEPAAFEATFEIQCDNPDCFGGYALRPVTS